jgi:hypothetical protein
LWKTQNLKALKKNWFSSSLSRQLITAILLYTLTLVACIKYTAKICKPTEKERNGKRLIGELFATLLLFYDTD